jgi:hypothetical protein
MKRATRKSQSLFILAMMLTQQPGSFAAQKPSAELDSWASRKVASVLRNCSRKSLKEIQSKLKELELEFSTQVDEIPIAELKKMSPESDFIEVGLVLFPAMLPMKFPGKLSYMSCDDEHETYLSSKDRAERDENLEELRDCFRRAYRADMPRLAGVALDCYQELGTRE